MKYAIIETGGKQYKVQEGEKLRIELVPGEAGQNIEFISVLAIHDGANLQLGTPTLAQAKISGRILKNDKADKILVFKKKRRKGYSKHFGHRQSYTEVIIDKITA